MRKYLLFFIALLVYAFPATATHIVGGEFEMRHLSGNNYRLSLNLYFDLVHGSPGAEDPDITVGIFEKGTNRLVMTRTLPLQEKINVNYTDITCAKPGDLRTAKLVYFGTITLSPATFNHPLGYYVVWERCCRNRIIENIAIPDEVGQAFYLEFPPVTRNGQPFRNSSPILFPPLSDYACKNELFNYDFSGTDPDGDSIVYDLVTPFRGSTDTLNPSPEIPSSAPYRLVSWIGGHSQTNQVLGAPPLTIHPATGRLTVRPTLSGLFVFGVRAQEYRNGVKIGEVRRDFQLMVRDDCSPNTKPTIVAQEKGKSGTYREGEVLQVSPTGERCIEIKFTDPDPSTRITLSTRPINFSRNNYTLSGVTTGNINSGSASDTLTATICFLNCFDTQGKIFEMDLIATDNGCSQPKLDTLRLRFIIEPVPDVPPTVRFSIPNEVFPPDNIFTVRNGELLNFNVIGNDANGDIISLRARGVDFDLASQNISFQNRNGRGPLTSVFSWPIDCGAMVRDTYKIEFTVTTQLCGVTSTATEVVEVRTLFPNTAPVIATDKQSELQEQLLVFELELNEAFEAKLFGNDIDLHQLMLTAAGQGFNLSTYGMTFQATGGEEGNAEGTFNWVANCDAAEQGAVRVDFLLREDACKPSPVQKLTMEFRVRVPDIEKFIPANIFTPNGDGLNDFFEMPTLPAITCTGSFERISIFNRWGKEVYTSADVNFRWEGKNVIAGVYYYVIDYTTSVYKGTVTIVH